MDENEDLFSLYEALAKAVPPSPEQTVEELKLHPSADPAGRWRGIDGNTARRHLAHQRDLALAQLAAVESEREKLELRVGRYIIDRRELARLLEECEKERDEARRFLREALVELAKANVPVSPSWALAAQAAAGE